MSQISIKKTTLLGNVEDTPQTLPKSVVLSVAWYICKIMLHPHLARISGHHKNALLHAFSRIYGCCFGRVNYYMQKRAYTSLYRLFSFVNVDAGY